MRSVSARRCASSRRRTIRELAETHGLDALMLDAVVAALDAGPSINAVYSIGGGNRATVDAFIAPGRRLLRLRRARPRRRQHPTCCAGGRCRRCCTTTFGRHAPRLPARHAGPRRASGYAADGAVADPGDHAVQRASRGLGAGRRGLTATGRRALQAGIEVLQPDLAARDHPALVVGGLDQPDLLRAAAVQRRPGRGELAVSTPRKKSVLLLTPTTWPRPPSQIPAPMLARVSTTLQCTPPWTSPKGWWKRGPAVQVQLTRSPLISENSRPRWLMNSPTSSAPISWERSASAVALSSMPSVFQPLERAASAPGQ